MILLHTWVDTPVAQALGWTLFHSLWQGAMVALALAAALAALQSPGARYAAACLAMLAMLAGGGLTFARFLPPQPMRAAALANARPLHLPASGSDPRLRPTKDGPESRLAYVLPWLAPFWMAGVVLFHLRSLAGWLTARRLRGTGVCCATDLWRDRLDRLRAPCASLNQ